MEKEKEKENVRPRESSGRPYPIPLNFKTKSKSPDKTTTPLRFLDYSKLRALEKYLLVVFDVFSFFIAFVCAQFLRNSQFHFQKVEWAYVFWPLTVLLPFPCPWPWPHYQRGQN